LAAGTGENGFVSTPYAVNFPNDDPNSGLGPIGLDFDKLGNLYVGDFIDGNLYRFPPGGGDATAPANKVSATPIGISLDGIAFSKSGRLYAIIQDEGQLVELDPNTGAVLRVVSQGDYGCGLETDPVTGNLFAMGCGSALTEISGFEGPGPITTTVVGVTVNGVTFGGDGFAIAPDGTIFTTVNRPDGSNGIDELTPTAASSTDAVTTITENGPGPIDGIALVPPLPGSTQITELAVNRNDGEIDLVDFADLNNVVITAIVTGGTRGDFVTTGPDGCLYATQSTEVDKVTNAGGGCDFIPPPAFTAGPSLSTEATPKAVSGNGTITDTATLSEGVNPTGSITFNLFAPSPTDDCSGQSQATSVVPVNGNGDYTSLPFSPTSLGTWHWTATYSGDGTNSSVSTNCDDLGESSLVRTQPTITTMASSAVPAGSTISDSATLSGASEAAAGTLTFNVYGPNDNTGCTASPAFSSTVDINGDGTYASDTFMPTVPGVYQFVANYSGDGDNGPVSSNCGDSAESVAVGTIPALTTQVDSATVTVGDIVSDTATLSGATAPAGALPSGTITFALYGPNDPNCTGTPETAMVAVANGNGSYDSGPLPTSAAGDYSFVASYSG
ncbi:MAG: hypothetical protein ACRDZ8_18315, partial [Acidimicrobiales bacterium]